MLVLSEDEALELLAFLVTAARTQVDEAPEYAPLRLLTAAQRLSAAILARVRQAPLPRSTTMPRPIATSAVPAIPAELRSSGARRIRPPSEDPLQAPEHS